MLSSVQDKVVHCQRTVIEAQEAGLKPGYCVGLGHHTPYCQQKLGMELTPQNAELQNPNTLNHRNSNPKTLNRETLHFGNFSVPYAKTPNHL